MLKIDWQLNKKTFFVFFEGSLNEKTCYKIDNYLIPFLNNNKITNIVLNFDKLSDIDNTGVKYVLKLRKIIKNKVGSFYILNNNKLINHKIKLLHIKKINTFDNLIGV